MVGDGLGLAVGGFIPESSLLGGDLASFLPRFDLWKIFHKFTLPFARQIRPLPLALAEFRLHRFPNRDAPRFKLQICKLIEAKKR